MMVVLGIDPGTAITGWGILDEQWEVKGFGCIKTKSVDSLPERLKIIHRELKKVIALYKPDAAAIEEIFVARNKQNTILVGEARGVAILAAAEEGIPVSEYSALQVKQALVGYGHAEKGQVQRMLKNILKLKEIPRPDDAADALAVAMCHLNSQKMRRISGGI